MGWHQSWSVTCESCHTLGPSTFDGNAAEKAAVEAGWLRGTVFAGIAVHLCPVCRGEKRGDKVLGQSVKWEETTK